MNQRNKMASMLTKKAKTHDQSTALTYLPSESRSKIVAANQMCAAMNATKNANAAMIRRSCYHPFQDTHLPPVRSGFLFAGVIDVV